MDITGKRFGKLVAIKRNTEKSTPERTYWTCKCDCGNVVDILLSNLNRPERFPSCGCASISYGEAKIEELLKSNGLSFTKEQTFDTCRNPLTQRKLRFDFYIEGQYLIEFDGEQHFFGTRGIWGGKETLEEI